MQSNFGWPKKQKRKIVTTNQTKTIAKQIQEAVERKEHYNFGKSN